MYPAHGLCNTVSPNATERKALLLNCAFQPRVRLAVRHHKLLKTLLFYRRINLGAALVT